MTEIILQKAVQTAEGARFDIMVRDLPKNFLGLAADISFEGDLAAADFQGMEWGEVFSGTADADQPIELVKVLPDQDKIVLGFTLKANHLLPMADGKTDGKLASLVFKNDKVTFKGFENQVLSVFDNGRRDLTDTVWTVTGQQNISQKTVSAPATMSRVAVADKTFSQPTETFSGSLDTEFSTQVQDLALREALNSSRASGLNGLWEWWWLILILVSLFPLLLLFLALANRKNKAGPGAALEALPQQIKLDY